jgi:hypothetical protein
VGSNAHVSWACPIHGSKPKLRPAKASRREIENLDKVLRRVVLLVRLRRAMPLEKDYFPPWVNFVTTVLPL